MGTAVEAAVAAIVVAEMAEPMFAALPVAAAVKKASQTRELVAAEPGPPPSGTPSQAPQGCARAPRL